MSYEELPSTVHLKTTVAAPQQGSIAALASVITREFISLVKEQGTALKAFLDWSSCFHSRFQLPFIRVWCNNCLPLSIWLVEVRQWQTNALISCLPTVSKPFLVTSFQMVHCNKPSASLGHLGSWIMVQNIKAINLMELLGCFNLDQSGLVRIHFLP